jgi:uncharacterized protein (TIGR00106 family)
MIVAFSISPAPADATGSVSASVADAIRVVRDSGLPYETNAMFTNIEGDWDEVMDVIRRAVDAVAATSPRVGLVMKADIRPGYTGQLTAKVERVAARLADHPEPEAAHPEPEAAHSEPEAAHSEPEAAHPEAEADR